MHGGTNTNGRCVDLVGQRLVLDQLKQAVLENDLPLTCGDIAADLERAFIGLRNAAALDVFHQVFETRLQAFSA